MKFYLLNLIYLLQSPTFSTSLRTSTSQERAALRAILSTSLHQLDALAEETSLYHSSEPTPVS